MDRVIEKGESNPNIGFDAYHGTYVDMFAAGIIDPTKVSMQYSDRPTSIPSFSLHLAFTQVIRTSLQDASGVASLLTTIDCGIAEIPKPEPAHSHGGMPQGGMGGMGF